MVEIEQKGLVYSAGKSLHCYPGCSSQSSVDMWQYLQGGRLVSKLKFLLHEKGSTSTIRALELLSHWTNLPEIR